MRRFRTFERGLSTAGFDLKRTYSIGPSLAREAIIHMWDGYADKELQCFLRDSTDCQPVFAQILPENNAHQLIAAAICLQCRELPPPAAHGQEPAHAQKDVVQPEPRIENREVRHVPL